MEKAENRPKIGLLSCIAFAVGTMIGAGVFVLSGPAIHNVGPAALMSYGTAGVFVVFFFFSGPAIHNVGPAALMSYGTAGVCVLFSALSFSVIASMAPAGA